MARNKKQPSEAPITSVPITDVHAIVRSAVEGALDGLSLKDWVKIGLVIGGIVIYVIGHLDSYRHADKLAAIAKIQTDSTRRVERLFKEHTDSLHDARQDSLAAARDALRNVKEDSILLLLKHKFHIK